MATIIIRNSTGSGVTPSSLVQGELAINTVDGKLFYGSGSGNVVKEFTGSGGGGGSTNTGSLLTTASFSNPNITFTKGDGSTFNVNLTTLVPTSASYALTASIADVATNALTSSTIVTIRESTNAVYYPTFVDSNNAVKAAENVYTNRDFVFNPGTTTFAAPIISASLGFAGSLTGSLLGTASYAIQALSASWAPSVASNPFPYTGSAIISGSLTITGSIQVGVPGVNLPAIDSSVGTLSRGTQAKVDWVNGYLNNSSGVTSVDWESAFLNDSNAITRVDWGNGSLNDSAGTAAFDWESRRMIDAAGARSADFDVRYLIYPNGTTTAINYGTQNQIAMTGSVSITGSLTISGSSTFTNIGPAIFSGSVDSQGGFTGSLQGTASYATVAQTLLGSVTSASYATTASYSLGPIRNIQSVTDGTTVTGTTSGTLTKSILIPANTVGVNDVIFIKTRARKTGNAGTLIVRMYVNTSAAIGGSLIATSGTNATSTVYFQYSRTLAVKSSTNTETMAGNFNVNPDDNVASSSTVSANNIDWTVDQYLVVVHTNGSAADSSVNSFAHIQINKG